MNIVEIPLSAWVQAFFIVATFGFFMLSLSLWQGNKLINATLKHSESDAQFWRDIADERYDTALRLSKSLNEHTEGPVKLLNDLIDSPLIELKVSEAAREQLASAEITVEDVEDGG